MSVNLIFKVVEAPQATSRMTHMTLAFTVDPTLTAVELQLE